MREKNVKQNLNLKTGFFRSESYIMLANQELIKLIPEKSENNEEVVIELSTIKNVNIIRGQPEEIEIRTGDDTYIASFPKKQDTSEIIDFLGTILKEKLFYN